MRYSKIQYICWLFSGAEISLLKECPTDFNRQASIGFTIFMTCLLAGLSGGFAAWRFTIDTPGQDGNWIASIIFGLVWGMLVFSIDRSMVVTLKKGGVGIYLATANTDDGEATVSVDSYSVAQSVAAMTGS